MQLQHSIHQKKRGSATPLGIHASIVAPPIDHTARSDAVNRRFKLQRFAREVLSGYLNPAHKPWRVVNCHRVLTGGMVQLIHHPEYSVASYGGLQTCASVHTCLVCATKIAARRAEEVDAGVVAWMARGGAVLMATFTMQHNTADSLGELHKVLNGQYREMRRSGSWREFAARVGLVGSITAREYTHGAAGWHPHLHALLFVRDLGQRELSWARRSLQLRWAHAVKAADGYAHPRWGCRVDLAADAAVSSYLTDLKKAWSAGDELARASTKKARRGSRTVGQLLNAAGGGDEHAAALFREYANVTYRHNHLVWTPKLRDELGLQPEQTDDEIAAEQDAHGELLVLFTGDEWRVILGNDARADVLLVADSGDEQHVAEFLAGFGIHIPAERLRPTFAP